MILSEIGEEEAIAALDMEIDALLNHPQSYLALRILFGADFMAQLRGRQATYQASWRAAHVDEHRQRNRECMRRARGYYERHPREAA